MKYIDLFGVHLWYIRVERLNTQDTERKTLNAQLRMKFMHRRAQQREQKLEQREIDRELLLNRNSPVRKQTCFMSRASQMICNMTSVQVREIQNIAKKRALERRERERLREGSSSRQRKSEPNILERTVKCCLLNGVVFAMSIVLFESVLLPLIQTLLYIILAGSQSRADALWSYTQPVLSVAFSTLWVLPFFLLSKVVNAIWFQDIADLAFR